MIVNHSLFFVNWIIMIEVIYYIELDVQGRILPEVCQIILFDSRQFFKSKIISPRGEKIYLGVCREYWSSECATRSQWHRFDPGGVTGPSPLSGWWLKVKMSAVNISATDLFTFVRVMADVVHWHFNKMCPIRFKHHYMFITWLWGDGCGATTVWERVLICVRVKTPGYF